MSKNILLKNLIQEKVSYLNKEWNDKPKKMSLNEKKQLLEKISTYNKLGKSLYSENDMIEIAKALQEIAESAQAIALDETNEAFDAITINRNMTEIKKLSEQFSKAATEAHSFKQRLTALYEDMGLLLNRYFHIKELNDGIEEFQDTENHSKPSGKSWRDTNSIETKGY